MPLPTDTRTPWPPRPVRAELDDIAEAAAWYSGDMPQLRSHAGGGKQLPRAKNEPRGPASDRLGNRGRFWQRRGTDTAPNRQQYHVPLASDIAAVSADLLFGEEPELRIDGAADTTGAGQPADPDARATQVRLDELAGEAGLHNRLLEAAEIAAALGGVWLRPVWDREVAAHPVLTAIHPDAAVPEFRFGMLQAVTFWTTVHEEGKRVWRHLERHEPGVILHGLYVGSKDELGVLRNLDEMPATEGLEPEIMLPAGVGLAARYVPNVLPNRRRRRSLQGRPDVQGSFDLLDALDETYTSWMRDLRLGQARIIAAEQALERGSGRGGGTWFDPDREVYAGLDIDPTDKTLIEPVQFAIRVDEHERTAVNLVERIVSAAGYAPQTFGLRIEGRAEAGTALRVREARTLRTRDRKQGYWDKPLSEAIQVLLAIDAAEFDSRITPARPSIRWGDAVVDDPREKAETLRLLRDAQAASVRTRVKMASPHLEGQELEDEVRKVAEEHGVGPLADPEEGPA